MKTMTWKVLLPILIIGVTLLLPFAAAIQSNQPTRDMILSADLPTAQKALEESKKHKNVQAVCLSLTHPSLAIKRQAVMALHDLNNQAAIKCLVEALENNQVVLLGGSEVQIEQGRLNESIVSAINAITGLSLSTNPRLSPTEVRNIKAETDRWLSARKQKK